MAIKQLTVFVENSRGRLVEVTKLLAAAGVDMRALSIADTKDFGILRLIVNDVDAAEKALAEGGFLARTTEVVGVRITDRPGELSRALSALEAGGIALEYLYAFLAVKPGVADVVLRVADNERAETLLRDAGYETM